MARGNYRDLAEFQSPTPEVDDYGNVSKGWTSTWTDFANLRESPGREQEERGANEGVRSADMRVLQCTETDAINERNRVICRGTTWDILSKSQPGNDPDVYLLRLESRYHGEN